MLLKGAEQGQQPTAGLGRSEGPAGLDDDSLAGPEGLEAGGAAWGQRGGGQVGQTARWRFTGKEGRDVERS